MLIKRKMLQRGITILQNSLNNLLLPVFNMVVSALVVRLASPELWGAFVGMMVVVQFGVHLVGWGNKEYLLREFSLHPQPQHIAHAWQTSLITRMMLIALLWGYILIFGGFSPQQAILCMIWAAALTLEQSCEVIILYRRAFLYDFAVELLTIALSVGFIVIRANMLRVEDLLMLFTTLSMLRLMAYAVRFPEMWRLSGLRLQLDFGYFAAAMPFFLLGFSGLLASRIDLYSVSLFLPEREVGQYQIFINLMLYVQSVSVFIVAPYAKSVYRLPDSAIFKIAFRLFALGVGLVIVGVCVAYFLLVWVYDLRFSLTYMLVGGAFALPIFAYLPLIYRLYKLKQTRLVLLANLIGAGVNFGLNLLFLPIMGSIGAALASALVQWGMLVVYLIDARGEIIRVMPEVSRAD